MKNTAFTAIHEKLGAKMVPFAGYNMPLQYEGLIIEHENVRKGVGVFDVSHMGEFWVEGPQALNAIQYITTNDASKLVNGKAQYSCFPNGNGGIVDDLLVYKFNDEKYLLVVNAANIEKDWNWVVKNNKYGAKLTNASDETSQLAIQGPKALEILQTLTSVNLSNIEYYAFEVGEIAGIKDAILSATGYTGAGGFEIYVPNSSAEKLWNAVMEAGQKYAIKPAGLACRDTLRLEMGYCLYGNDIDDTTSPIEAGLGWITKITDYKDFIDKDKIVKIKEEGPKRKLVGFEMIDRGIPRHGYNIVDANGNVIGVVTSGTQGPSINKAVGMGYVKTELSKIDSEIYVEIRDKRLKAKVVKMPFYKA